MTATEPANPDGPGCALAGAPALTRRQVFDLLAPNVGRLVAGMVRRAPHLAPDREDMEQEGLLILWNIVGRYDASRSNPRTFGLKRIRFQLIDWLRARRGSHGIPDRVVIRRLAAGQFSPSCLSYHGDGADRRAPASRTEHKEAGGRGVSFAASMGRRDAEVTDSPRDEFLAAVRRTGADLGSEELSALADYYVSGRTMKDIGRGYGVSESRMSQLISRAVSAIREQMRATGRTTIV